MNSALTKVLVMRFYERHAGFFLAVFYLMFGVVESSQLVSYHYSLLLGMVTAPVFLGMVSIAWTAYWIKVLIFLRSRFDLAENEFLYNLGLLSRRSQLMRMARVLGMTMLPVLFYAAAAVAVAFFHGAFLAAAAIIVFQAGLVAAGAFLLHLKVERKSVIGTPAGARSAAARTRRRDFPRPLPLVYLNFLTAELKTMLWLSKAFSAACIVGFLQITTDGYDARTAALGLLFALACHTGIVFEFRRFEDQYLFFTRALPISTLRRFAILATVWLIIFLPETVLMLVNNIRLADAAGLLLFGVGFMLLLHTALYSGALSMEVHLTTILAAFLITFAVILWNAYAAEAACFWVIAYVSYARKFYSYEPDTA